MGSKNISINFYIAVLIVILFSLSGCSSGAKNSEQSNIIHESSFLSSIPKPSVESEKQDIPDVNPQNNSGSISDPSVPFELRNSNPRFSPMYPEILTNTLMVQFKPGVNLDQLNKNIALGSISTPVSFKQVNYIPQINWYRISVTDENGEVLEPKIVAEKSSEAMQTIQLIFNIKNSPLIENAEPVRPRYFQYTNTLGPDPLLNGLFKDPSGNPIISYQFDKCKIKDAWKETTGDPSISCVVVDSGIEYGNPEFENRIDPVSKDFILGSLMQAKGDGSATLGDGIDNDGNGEADDEIFHGTLVASCVTGLKDNSLYACGVSPDTKLISFRVLSGDGDSSSTTDEISAAITAAADITNVRVINLSLGSVGDTQSESQACLYARGKNKTLIASAGNIDRSILGPGEFPPVYYPAGYPTVIAVGATDKVDKITTFSNFGSFVDIVAPGSQILGPMFPYPDNTFNPYYIGFGNGTSFSGPIVAGAAMLLYSVNPDLTPAQIQDALVTTTDNISSINPSEVGFGSGRLNVYEALLSIKPNTTNDITKTGNDIDLSRFSANVEIDTVNKKVSLKPDLYNGNVPVTYVMYKFEEIPESVQTGYIEVGCVGYYGLPKYWVGVPNSSKNTWIWYGPFRAADLKFNLTRDMNWLNKQNELKIAIVAWDGIGMDIHKVFFHYNEE